MMSDTPNVIILFPKPRNKTTTPLNRLTPTFLSGIASSATAATEDSTNIRFTLEFNKSVDH